MLHGEVITRRLLERAGRSMRYFRYPYNHRGTDTRTKDAFEAFLEERGYRIASFTIEHADYAFNEVYVAARLQGEREMMERTRRAYLEHLDTKFAYFEKLSVDLLGREIAQIFLIHVNEINAVCMEEMLRRIEARGYRFVSLDKALEDEAYSAPDLYIDRWGPSWLHRWAVSRGDRMRTDEPDPPSFVMEAYDAVIKQRRAADGREDQLQASGR